MPTSPDPIHVAIATHRRALAAYEAAFEISGNMAAGDPGFSAAAAVTARAFAVLEKSGVALLAVRPTTLAGLAALLEHIADCAHGEDRIWQLPDRLIDHGGGYERAAGDDTEGHTEPFAVRAISAAAETIKRLSTG